MKKLEKDVWKLVKKNFLGYAERVETKTGGLSDVIYNTTSEKSGYLELKRVQEWPKRKTTKLDFGLRPEQGLFLDRWTRHKGRGWILVSIEEEFLLFNGSLALVILQKIDRSTATFCAHGVWKGEPDWAQLDYIL